MAQKPTDPNSKRCAQYRSNNPEPTHRSMRDGCTTSTRFRPWSVFTICQRGPESRTEHKRWPSGSTNPIGSQASVAILAPSHDIGYGEEVVSLRGANSIEIHFQNHLAHLVNIGPRQRALPALDKIGMQVGASEEMG